MNSIVLLNILLFLSDTAQQSTQITFNNFKHIVYITAGICLGIAIAAYCLAKAIKRSPKLSQPTPSEFKQSYFTPMLTNTILENLRSDSRSQFYLALQQIVNSAVYDDAIVLEMSKIVGKHVSHKNKEWLNSDWNCRLCRILHLMIERNKAASEGRRFDEGISFEALIVNNDGYCLIKGQKPSFLKNLVLSTKDFYDSWLNKSA